MLLRAVSLIYHVRPFPYIRETLMSATAFPEAPSNDTSSSTAIQLAVQKGTEEINVKKDRQRNVQVDEGQPVAIQYPSPKSEPNRQSSGSSQVDIPLDSPAQEEDHSLFMNGIEEVEEDNLRTPRLGSNFRDQLPLHANASLPSKSKSSSTVWAGLIASAVDHTDVHVTK